ncbi:MAG: hypothetical protein JHC39_05540 [Lentimicrobium sp.]|jgi:hypothetical protein|nr:hypothetical protein [Lentimicrobium sp.]
MKLIQKELKPEEMEIDRIVDEKRDDIIRNFPFSFYKKNLAKNHQVYNIIFFEIEHLPKC